MSTRSARRNIVIVLLALGLAAGAWFFSRGSGTASRSDPQQAAAADAAKPAAPSFNPDFVKTTLPVQQLTADTIPVTGKLSLDQQQVQIASARVAGRLGRIFVFEGQAIKAGQALAELYSPEYISAEQEFLLAKRFKDTLPKDGADAELSSDADATYQSAASKLQVLGASKTAIAELANTGVADQYLIITSPISGVVTQRNVDPGGYLNIGDSLMTVANTKTLWLYFNSYEADYASLKIGQELSFQTGSLPAQQFTGRVGFIAPSIDPASHTLPIRCDILNPDLRLRPEMFIQGTLKIGERKTWVVPKTAVIHIRDTDYVIIKSNDGQYSRVPVQGHPLPPDQYAITSGLTEALPVVSDGGVLINELVNES